MLNTSRLDADQQVAVDAIAVETTRDDVGCEPVIFDVSGVRLA